MKIIRKEKKQLICICYGDFANTVQISFLLLFAAAWNLKIFCRKHVHLLVTSDLFALVSRTSTRQYTAMLSCWSETGIKFWVNVKCLLIQVCFLFQTGFLPPPPPPPPPFLQPKWIPTNLYKQQHCKVILMPQWNYEDHQTNQFSKAHQIHQMFRLVTASYCWTYEGRSMWAVQHAFHSDSYQQECLISKPCAAIHWVRAHNEHEVTIWLYVLF